jgi:hypothetical protein
VPDLIALRALFGQDEANHGTSRYRVGIDGLVTVPPEAAVYLIKNAGFSIVRCAAASRSKPQPGSSRLGPFVRLHHDTADGCSYGGDEYLADPNGDVLVPAEAVVELMAHGFTPDRSEDGWKERVRNATTTAPASPVSFRSLRS